MNSLSSRIKAALLTDTPIGVSFCRLGRPYDGGYVVIDDFSANDYLISMGVQNDVSFEKALENRVSFIDVYDFSISCLPEPIANSRFFKEKIKNNSYSVLTRAPEDKDLILKIDIEGSEWEFLPSLSHTQVERFRQIAIEIHWLIDTPEIKVPDIPMEVLERLSQTHQLVSIHPNNYGGTVVVEGVVVPQVLELTYLRKSSYSFSGVPGNPAYLFMPNNPEEKEIEAYL